MTLISAACATFYTSRGPFAHLRENPIRVFPKCFHWSEFSDKIFVITVKGLEPATSCVRDQDATTAPARHMWEIGSLNWAQFMIQWFISFPEFAEFTEFNESSAPFRKNSIMLASSRRHCCDVQKWVSPFISVVVYGEIFLYISVRKLLLCIF